MLKLKLQQFGHLMQRTNLLEKTLMLGKNAPGFDPWVGKIPLEKGKATHYSILAWRIPWTIQLELDMEQQTGSK